MYTLKELEGKIATHTLQLAKRQRTFNASQFPPHIKAPFEMIKPLIEKVLKEF